LTQILIVFFCFAFNEKLKFTSNQSDLDIKTVQKIYRLIRLYYSKYISKTKHKIDGKNDSVQIEETHISKLMYNKGRILCHFWLIDGISEKINDIVVTSHTNRNQIVMKNIIIDNVAEKTLIKTDCWKGYNWIKNSGKYTHQTVNHKLNFKNPKDGTHINKVEGLWLEVKELKRRRGGLKIDTIETFVNEFI
jgi:hypothetical protein